MSSSPGAAVNSQFLRFLESEQRHENAVIATLVDGVVSGVLSVSVPSGESRVNAALSATLATPVKQSAPLLSSDGSPVCLLSKASNTW